jgi:hypothetical protein
MSLYFNSYIDEIVSACKPSHHIMGWFIAVVVLICMVYLIRRARNDPVYICWDIDQTLLIATYRADTVAATIAAKLPSPRPLPTHIKAQGLPYFALVDDDYWYDKVNNVNVNNCHIYWRPWIRLVFQLMRPFAHQYLYTAAQGTPSTLLFSYTTTYLYANIRT